MEPNLLEILKYPDLRLKRKSEKVEKLSSELVKLGQSMLSTMYQFKGIGLAAPQVNQLTRLIVVDTKWHRKPQDDEKFPLTDLEKSITGPIVLFNPEIVKKEGKTSYTEGCLSVPGYFEDVPRANYVEVTGLDSNENPVTIKTDGLIAVCLQHEIDHLDGFMFIDRLSLIKSTRLKAKIKKYGYATPESSEGHDVL